MAIMKGAEPFFYHGGDKGVLLIHGFTGSPSEMRLLGEDLHGNGYTVLGPRLTGHGTNHREMALTNWPIWYGAVEDGYHLLKSMCREVAVVGLSMGGLMALKLAIEYEVKCIAALSTPVYLYERRLPLLPLYKMFRSYVPKKRKRFADVDPSYSVCYDYTPLSSLESLLHFIKHVQKLLPLLDKPLLVAHSRAEHTVRPESAQYIFDHAGVKDKELYWLEKSGHVVTLDCERAMLFAKINRFLEDHYG